MHNLRNELMHYTNDLSDGADLKAEAVAAIEQIAQYMEKDVLLHHSRPLALAYLALTEEVDSVPVVYGRWIPSESDFDDDDTLFDVEEWCDWQCSACREDICYEDPMPPRLLPKYCPNCGAKMDGKDGGDNNANREVD